MSGKKRKALDFDDLFPEPGEKTRLEVQPADPDRLERAIAEGLDYIFGRLPEPQRPEGWREKKC